MDDWREQANCLGRADEMFPPPDETNSIHYLRTARKICRECPVKSECLDWVVTLPPTDIQAGVWAGLTSRQVAEEQQRRLNEGLLDESDIMPTIHEIQKSFGRYCDAGLHWLRRGITCEACD